MNILQRIAAHAAQLEPPPIDVGSVVRLRAEARYPTRMTVVEKKDAVREKVGGVEVEKSPDVFLCVWLGNSQEPQTLWFPRRALVAIL